MVGKEKFKEINRLLNQKLEEKKVLIAVHRGCGCGNIIENTGFKVEDAIRSYMKNF